MNKKVNINLATPMYGGSCFGEYVSSVVNLQAVCISNNIGFKTNYIYNESLITRGRNELVYQFLKDGSGTHLLFVDSDIQFNANDVLKMVNYDKDIVCGTYPKKSIDWNKVVYAVNNGMNNPDDLEIAACNYAYNSLCENQKDLIKMFEGTDLIEVKHAATGFMLIKREVFINLFNKVNTYTMPADVYGTDGERTIRCFFDTKISENKEYLSEDWFFCELWRKYGGKIYIDPQIRLKHIGMKIFG